MVYKGIQFHFPARLVQAGYVHRFEVEIEGYEIWFEPDEEHNYRALVDAAQLNKIKMEVGLLKAVAEAIESLLK